jgi:hypothetical protein
MNPGPDLPLAVALQNKDLTGGEGRRAFAARFAAQAASAPVDRPNPTTTKNERASEAPRRNPVLTYEVHAAARPFTGRCDLPDMTPAEARELAAKLLAAADAAERRADRAVA